MTQDKRKHNILQETAPTHFERRGDTERQKNKEGVLKNNMNKLIIKTIRDAIASNINVEKQILPQT